MENLVKFGSRKSTITSLELVEQINLFRSEIEGKSEILHKNLLQIIRDEFQEEIGRAEISAQVSIRELNGGVKKEDPYFELTLSQARQVLVRESRLVRKAVMAYLDKLEETQFKLPMNYKDALRALVESEEEKERLQKELQEVCVEHDKLIDEIEDAEEVIEELEEQLEEQKPLVEFAKAVMDSSDAIEIGEFAKLICGNGINIGEKRLFRWLRGRAYLMEDNYPYQRYLDNEWFKVVYKTREVSYGTKSYSQTLITPKGQVKIIEKLRKAFG